MVQRDLVEAKLAELAHRLDRVVEHRTGSSAALAAFKRLAEHGIVDAAASERLIRATGFRNVVAHAYGKLDPSLAYLAATEGVEDLRGFAQSIAAFLRPRR